MSMSSGRKKLRLPALGTYRILAPVPAYPESGAFEKIRPIFLPDFPDASAFN